MKFGIIIITGSLYIPTQGSESTLSKGDQALVNHAGKFRISRF